LRHGIRIIQQEDGDFFVRLGTDIYRAMRTITRRVPVDLTRFQLDSSGRAVSERDFQRSATQDDRDAVTQIAVPMRSLTPGQG
jgi:hypothetical protein